MKTLCVASVSTSVLFVTTLELTVSRVAVTASFLYCLYRVFMQEIGR